MAEVVELTERIAFSAEDSRSESSRMVEKLVALPDEHCITVVPQTEDRLTMPRLRTHWANAASRAGIKITSRVCVTEHGERALRIWRVSKDQ
jgi:hypothetical protein